MGGPEREAASPADDGADDAPAGERAAPGKETPMAFSLTSPAFDHEGTIPVRFTCDGEDVSPALSWSEAPEDAERFALVVDDPDAPGGPFVHWVLYGIPGHFSELPEAVGDAPRLDYLGEAVNGRNDFDDLGYGGPCPPPGDPHRYVFTLYALDADLGLDPGATKGELEEAMEGRVLGEADLTGTYRRR
ncbi:MAG: YbhB/YbcL family Raf kinase inhibitor-like protein [Gemmatimonadota bacterium]|nr:YbhB/YbcL family Raf kinase inhibitor-like protein [Gemmatimonadota bacterium]